jgi:hypothetical protein
MENRGSLVIALVLILLGGLFLVFNFIPGLNFGVMWPIIFIILAAGFFLPSLVWPAMRRGLSALFIPGSILLVLGLIFFYNTITQDWVSWAYSWILLTTGVGLGLYLASSIGDWDRVTTQVGLWMMVISVAVFALFAALFGGTAFLRVIGPGLLVIGGVLFLINSFRKPANPQM